jgi:hypothetical protein
MAMIGLRSAERLALGRELGSGDFNLRHCGQIFGFGVIQFLLCNQAGAGLGGLFEAF